MKGVKSYVPVDIGLIIEKVWSEKLCSCAQASLMKKFGVKSYVPVRKPH